MPFQCLNKQAHMSIWPSVWGMFYHITCDFRCLWFCSVLSFSKCLFQHNVDTCKVNCMKGSWLKFVYNTFLSTDRSQSWLSAVESMAAPQCPCQWNTFYQYYRYWRQVMTITVPATESMDVPVMAPTFLKNSVRLNSVKSDFDDSNQQDRPVSWILERTDH